MDQKKSLRLYKQLMLELRGRLKKLKLSYEDVSREIHVPASTIKKWFAADDGALSRVHAICNVIGVSLSDVLKSIEQQDVYTLKMGDSQQKHFLKDIRAFEVYWCTVYERLNEAQTMEKLNMKAETLAQCLIRLDRLKLIRLSAQGKPIPQKVIPVRWNAEGPFMSGIFKSWTSTILEDALKSEPKSHLILQHFQISEESRSELIQDLQALEEKYARRTSQDMRVRGLELKKVRFLSALAEGSFLRESSSRLKT